MSWTLASTRTATALVMTVFSWNIFEHFTNVVCKTLWGRLNIKVSSYQYRDTHVKDNMVISIYLGQMVFLQKRYPWLDASFSILLLYYSHLHDILMTATGNDVFLAETAYAKARFFSATLIFFNIRRWLCNIFCEVFAIIHSNLSTI